MEEKLEVYTRSDEIRIRKEIAKVLKNENVNFELYVWPSRIRTSDYRSWFELEKYEEFKEWAEKNGVDLSPHFKKNEYENKKDKKHKEIIFPVASIAVYRGKGLDFVFPCQKENVSYTVGNLINKIQSKDSIDRMKNIINEIRKGEVNKKEKKKKEKN